MLWQEVNQQNRQLNQHYFEYVGSGKTRAGAAQRALNQLNQLNQHHSVYICGKNPGMNDGEEQ
ncbi:hypothetical protein DO233_12960 [Salmonella enterica]|nr:hypothetical protein [Salmonella enterica]EBJ1200319.1 hypothetical protein [Salmonella enterica]EBN9019088.1 hypothetical protein [Salmonella enterica]